MRSLVLSSYRYRPLSRAEVESYIRAMRRAPHGNSSHPADSLEIVLVQPRLGERFLSERTGCLTSRERNHRRDHKAEPP